MVDPYFWGEKVGRDGVHFMEQGRRHEPRPIPSSQLPSIRARMIPAHAGKSSFYENTLCRYQVRQGKNTV